MYEPFKLSEISPDNFMERFSLSLDIPSEPADTPSIFTEATFVDGKKTLAPLVAEFQSLKDQLEEQIKKEGKDFSALNYVRNLKFKQLEDNLRKSFGFRNIEIICENDFYSPEEDTFRSKYDGQKVFTAYTYPTWRYPIDGLVTDKGFYDSTHSINTEITFSLNLLRLMTAEELVGIFLHEFGHNLDPALVDITYQNVNVYSKYLTDRQGSINDKEKKIAKKTKFGALLAIVGVFTLMGFIGWLINKIKQAIRNRNWDEKDALGEFKKQLAADKSKFDRYYSSEAFADNFARMYGFGPACLSGIEKLERHYAGIRNDYYKVGTNDSPKTRIQKEKMRQQLILDMMGRAMKGVHKTDIHRIHALMKEYESELKDKSVPAKVKKDIEADMKELKLVLDKYLNEYSNFEKRVYQIIWDDLESKSLPVTTLDPNGSAPDTEGQIEKGAAPADDDKTKPVTEAGALGVHFYTEAELVAFTESSDGTRSLNKKERDYVVKKFGKDVCDQVSFVCEVTRHHGDTVVRGYYCKTHRARSKTREKLEDMTEKEVKFVASTS